MSDRSIYLAASESRSLGGFQQYVRNIVSALEPRPIDVLEYKTLPVFEEYASNARVIYEAPSQTKFAARLAVDYLRRDPTVFIISHVGLMRALTATPRQPRHRVVLLIAGLEAWHRLSKLRGLPLSKVDSVAFFARFNRDVFLASNHEYLRPDVATKMIWLSCTKEQELERPAPVPTGAQRRCVFVSRITKGEPLKGLATLLRSAKHLDPATWAIDIVGAGDALADYQKMAADLGVTDRVRFAGRVSHEERSAIVRAADVMCLPSAQEGFGLVFLEAMIVGRPSVGAAATAIPEVLPLSAGELAPYGDELSLARAIERASARLRSGELTPESLRSVYDTRYSFEKFATAWREYIDELRGESSPP